MLLAPGTALYILGPNGSGKSTLVHRLNSDHRAKSRWIPPHRRTWMQSGGSGITAADKEQQEISLRTRDTRGDARYRDRNPDLRVQMAIFDLIQKRGLLNQQIANAFRAADHKHGQKLIEENEDPLDALSVLLNDSGLPFEFSVDRNANIVATKSKSVPYSVAEMSDGERNALLLAAEVLTVQPETLILIDEPELHLHRSIVSPLLRGLFSKRQDCYFVVSTHELSLPIDDPDSKILLVRGCTFEDGIAMNWDVDLVDSSFDIDEGLKKEVLGARRTIVFVEGEQNSLDRPLYSLLFPTASIIPRGSKKSVEDTVRGLRASGELHWITPFGIVDSDGQLSDEGMEKLRDIGVFPIDCYSIESIYFDEKVQEEVAKRRTSLTGETFISRLAPATEAAIDAIRTNAHHLAKIRACRRLNDELIGKLPNPLTSHLDQHIQVDLDAPTVLQQELEALNKLIDSNDLGAIIRKYPIKKTAAPDRISKQLGFDNQKEYSKAVLKLLQEDEGMLKYVKQLLGKLPNEFDE